MALAALGGPMTDPLQAMATAVGDFALLAARPTPVAPLSAGDPPATASSLPSGEKASDSMR